MKRIDEIVLDLDSVWFAFISSHQSNLDELILELSIPNDTVEFVPSKSAAQLDRPLDIQPDSYALELIIYEPDLFDNYDHYESSFGKFLEKSSSNSFYVLQLKQYEETIRSLADLATLRQHVTS